MRRAWERWVAFFLASMRHASLACKRSCYPQAEQASRLRDWTTGMVVFDKILSNLKAVTATHDSDFSSEEEDQAVRS